MCASMCVCLRYPKSLIITRFFASLSGPRLHATDKAIATTRTFNRNRKPRVNARKCQASRKEGKPEVESGRASRTAWPGTTKRTRNNYRKGCEEDMGKGLGRRHNNSVKSVNRLSERWRTTEGRRRAMIDWYEAGRSQLGGECGNRGIGVADGS